MTHRPSCHFLRFCVLRFVNKHANVVVVPPVPPDNDDDDDDDDDMSGISLSDGDSQLKLYALQL